MKPGPYLVVELPGPTTPGATYSRNHPAAVMDLIMGKPRSGPAGAALDAVILVRGAPAGTLGDHVAAMDASYPELRTMERDDDGGLWLASFRVPVAALRDPAVAALGGFLATHGLDMQWVRVEQGQAYIRAAVPEGANAMALADRCRGFLEARGIDADVAVDPGAVDHFGPWRDIVKKTLDAVQRA